MKKPSKFLEKENGGLVTLGSLFNGMESARVVFIYENPYASHFRANYMRASVELILIDRNESGTEIFRSSWRRVDVAGETALELELEEALASDPILSTSKYHIHISGSPTSESPTCQPE